MNNTIKNRHQSEYDIYEDVEKIKSALSMATRDIKGRASEILTNSLEDIKGTTTKATETAENYIATKPLQSVGIALLVGATIGFLLRRK